MIQLFFTEEPPDSVSEEQDFGEPRPYDPGFKGPIAERNCTDVLCCMVFILFVLGYILLGLAAWVHGDPRRVAYPTDSEGHFCGQKGTPYENKSILFYFNLFSCASPSVLINLQCPTTQICVSKCPEKFLTYLEIQTLYKRDESYWEYYRQFCKPSAKLMKTISETLLDNDCPKAIFPGKPFLQRCFPDFSTKNGTLTVGSRTLFEDGSGKTRNAIELRQAANGVNKILEARSVGLKVFEDYVTTWHWILMGLIIAMILSWMFLILMRFIAGFLFWFFMFGVLGIIAYAILLSITEGSVVLLLIFLRKQIRVAIFLMKEGSRAIGCIPGTLLYPILTFILLSICISYWAVTAIFLATSGIPIYKVVIPQGQCIHENKTCDPEIFNTTDIPKVCPGALCIFASYGGKSLYHQYISTFHVYNLFVFLWLVNFVIALGQCALSGAFATYYWTGNKCDDIPPHPLFTSFGRALRYHTGSLAFGSLLIALIQFYRIVLQYMDRHLKNAQNNIAKFFQCCLKCCFWCLENVVKFLNKNAYIMIAVHGENFCTSARDAFNLLMRNIVKVAVTDEVTFLILLLGKILVTGIIGVLAFLLFTERMPIIVEGPTSLNYYWVPLLTVIFGSYLIAHGFFSVYAMCVETIFICFLEDLDRNSGTVTRPYFMTESLLKILMKDDIGTKRQ
ncbi:choline transporter-like protein 5 isoform X7 [Ochotona princeps]|uniref:choline transporter-like protein 5 isoform X7 n=1 Tax=Ochotona princeps TaxID=9978 RepID=UPI002715331A|nr:choline transporter-like protein 5 isoform X7 [Ochotona princeps]